MKSERAEKAIADIDAGLAEAAAVTIESALEYAIQNGTMTIKEAEQCLIAYHRAFLDGRTDDAVSAPRSGATS